MEAPIPYASIPAFTCSPYAILKRHTVNCMCRIPKLGGNDLDLHVLYKEVTSRGGLEQVILLASPIFADYPHISLITITPS